MATQLFIVPKTRLVKVEYWNHGTKYAATIEANKIEHPTDKPASGDAIKRALLARRVSWNVNVSGVYAHHEHNPQSS